MDKLSTHNPNATINRGVARPFDHLTPEQVERSFDHLELVVVASLALARSGDLYRFAAVEDVDRLMSSSTDMTASQ